MTRSMLRDLETCYEKLVKAREERKEKGGEQEQTENTEPEVKKMRKEDEEEEKNEGWKVKEQVTPLMSGTRSRVYRPLLSRPTCG